MEQHRPTPLVEDLETTRNRLAAWLSERQGGPVEVSDLQIPEATGMSNVTLLFHTSWDNNGTAVREACVGRLQPEIEKPVFRDYDLGQQYRIMDILGRETDIPVPILRGLESDPAVLGVPFYIMKKTEGRIPTDMPPYNMDGWLMHETSPAQRRQLWNAGIDVMARFHQLDYQALGIDFLDGDGQGTALQRQLSHWRDYHDWALEGRRHAICSRALDWLDAHQPQQETTGLCWGDARIGNLIFTPDCSQVAAVLDWEMAVLGNPLQDLAWYCFTDNAFADGLGLPRLEGMPDYEDSMARWLAATGFATDDFQYYWIFAGMRYGLILSRIMMASGQPEQEIQENFVCKLLQRYLDAL